MNKTDFKVAKEGFIDGVWRAVGEPIRMNETQAAHLLISGQIERPKSEAASGEIAASETGVDPASADETAQSNVADEQPSKLRRR